ncbi:ribbon-helix-helix domain-containing protein [Desulfurivibrio dismutans]|uniref:ribbon-helix-helix domain-containing protein n=1 Tax=Desulfurivibrio dismutans TaxID=1398908 RepID=UPI0023DA45C4|nr:hypothetical protein [Desulfurivibrio alkaliphilus]MDF1613511.1 hypothetical protein [Desulfurivibrio alkaliphilus]
MANLQVKGIDDDLYEQVKRLAAAENRSVSQELVFMIKSYVARQKILFSTPTPAEVLLQLSGSWKDSRTAAEIIKETRKSRVDSTRLANGL